MYYTMFINCEEVNIKYKEAMEFFENDKHKYNLILSNKQYISDFIVDKIYHKYLPSLREEKYVVLFQKMRRIYKKITKLEKEEEEFNDYSDADEGFIIEQPNTEIKFKRNQHSIEEITKNYKRRQEIEKLLMEVSRIRIILQKLIFFERSTVRNVSSKLNDFMINLNETLS